MMLFLVGLTHLQRSESEYPNKKAVRTEYQKQFCGSFSLPSVVGFKGAEWGEAVKAFLVLKQGANCEPDSLIKICKESLASYKAPKVVEFLSSLPLTDSVRSIVENRGDESEEAIA